MLKVRADCNKRCNGMKNMFFSLVFFFSLFLFYFILFYFIFFLGGGGAYFRMTSDFLVVMKVISDARSGREPYRVEMLGEFL